MLAKLFGSKTRVEMLKLFLTNSDKQFYIRQISRDLELQLNSVRRELDNLDKFGLLKVVDENGAIKLPEVVEASLSPNLDRNGRKLKTPVKKVSGKLEKKYYTVNKDFILYDELKSLISKSQTMYENDIVEHILKISKPRLFILTGCFVNNPDAEADLLLVGEFNKTQIVKIIADFEKKLNREINFTILTEDEFIYRRDMTDVFIYTILGGKNIVVIDEIGSV